MIKSNNEFDPDKYEKVYTTLKSQGFSEGYCEHYALKEAREAPKLDPESSAPLISDTGNNVNHPSHYQGRDGIEAIEVIHNTLTKDGFISYCKGNVEKYIFRYQKKNGLEDLKKAKIYLTWMIEEEEGDFKVEQK